MTDLSDFIRHEYEPLAENNRHTHANLNFCIGQRVRLERRVAELEEVLQRLGRMTHGEDTMRIIRGALASNQDRDRP